VNYQWFCIDLIIVLLENNKTLSSLAKSGISWRKSVWLMSCEDCHFCGVLCGLRTCVVLMCLRFKQSLVRLLEILIVGEKQRERIYSRHGLAMNNPANPRASGGTVETRLNSKRWSGEWIDTRLFDTVDQSLSWWWNVNNPWSGPDWRQRRRRKSGKICLPSHVSWWFKKTDCLGKLRWSPLLARRLL
jgi:hypothetical protein